MCRLNLILNSNEGLTLFRQKQILRSNTHENLQKQNNEYFFIQLLNAWLHFTSLTSLPTSTEELLDQLISSPHTKMDFTSDNPYFYCIRPGNISNKFTIIRDLCRFLPPDLISSMTFYDKLGFPTANHKKIYELIMDSTHSDWKHLPGTKTSQKSLIKSFYYNNKGTSKVKDFQKLSNKVIYFTLQSVSTKYNKLFKFILWPNFL